MASQSEREAALNAAQRDPALFDACDECGTDCGHVQAHMRLEVAARAAGRAELEEALRALVDKHSGCEPRYCNIGLGEVRALLPEAAEGGVSCAIRRRLRRLMR